MHRPQKVSAWFTVLLLTFLLGGVFFTTTQPAHAIDLPTDFVETQVATGLPKGTTLRFAPDGRLFVLQQTGSVHIIDNDVLLPTPALEITVSTLHERGLLGIAFDPNFPTEPYVYLYYIQDTSPTVNRVSRFEISGNVIDPESEEVILDMEEYTGLYHVAGAINFGPDGKLYIATGDDSKPNTAQSMSSLKGKILRINKDGTIPTDNPFYATATDQYRAIWNLGLRNPFTAAFQPGTGNFYINDVGQDAFEEVNAGVAGANFGWPHHEGVMTVPDPQYTDPVFAYGHDAEPELTGCSIGGAAFYNPSTVTFPTEYVGKYFFGDYCARWIATLDTTTHEMNLFATNTVSQFIDLQISDDGAVYYLARGGGGSVNKIEYVEPVTPTETPTPTATPTETPEPTGTELIVNGGFEAALEGNWKVKNATGDKVKTDKPEKDKFFARTGDNAFMFKGGAGENSKIVQKPALESVSFATGDTLTFSLWSDVRKTPNTKYKVVVKYSDTTDKTKVSADLILADGYYISMNTLELLSANVSNIKVVIANKSASGKVFIDDVSLLHESGTLELPEAAQELLPLPDVQ